MTSFSSFEDQNCQYINRTKLILFQTHFIRTNDMNHV